MRHMSFSYYIVQFFYYIIRMMEDTVVVCLNRQLLTHPSIDTSMDAVSEVVFQFGIGRCLQFKATENLSPATLHN